MSEADTKIDGIPDSAIFITHVLVQTSLGKFKDEVRGKVSVTYDPKTNLINIKLLDAQFEVALDLGKSRLVLKKIQLADYLTQPLQFEGPGNLSNQFNFNMPNGEVKRISLQPTATKMKVLDDKIIVTATLNFTDTLQVKK